MLSDDDGRVTINATAKLLQGASKAPVAASWPISPALSTTVLYSTCLRPPSNNMRKPRSLNLGYGVISGAHISKLTRGNLQKFVPSLAHSTTECRPNIASSVYGNLLKLPTRNIDYVIISQGLKGPALSAQKATDCFPHHSMSASLRSKSCVTAACIPNLDRPNSF